MALDINLGRYILKPFVVLATDNQNIASAPATINNVTLASGDRVFLIGQSTATQNGGYVFNGAGSAMTRTTDLAVGAVIKSGTVFQVLLGRPHRQIFFQIHATADEVSDITIGTTAFTYRFVNDGKISYAGYIPAASGLQADATDLLSTHSVILLGGDDYSAKVPLNSAFQYMVIDNSLRNYTLKLFPSSGGTLGAGVDTHITIYPYEIVYLYGIGNIGNGQEWVVYRPVSQSLTVGVKHKAPSEDAVYDALLTKEDAFSKNTAFNKNFGTAAGTVLEGNSITQTITNGVTTKAPSEDVVYDALELKSAGTYYFGFNNFNPADSTNYYFNHIIVAPSTTVGARPFKFAKAGVIDSAEWNLVQVNNGSAENVTLVLRNGTTGVETSIGVFQSNFGANTHQGFNYTGLSITVNTTDFYTIKIEAPAFGTNPTGWIGTMTLNVK